MKPRQAVEVQWEERLDPRRPNPLWGEHRARYRFAQARANGARVLDVACGCGYGSQMLEAAGGAPVVGVDYSADAVRFARDYYAASSSARFLRADVEALPFPDESFELATCFETIEHVPRPQAAVGELARVLAPPGALLISSPNGAYYLNGHSGNPYHYTEFRVDELLRLLKPHFARVDVFGQRLTRRTPGILSSGSAEEPAKGSVATESVSLRRRVFSWLPYRAQDLAWRLLRGEPYYPTEDEFALESDRPERFPVIVAVCTLE